MNLYCCLIDLKQDAKALAFAAALDAWMGHLQAHGAIGAWRLYRSKLNLAADTYRDFLLEIEVEDLSQLDRAFRLTGKHDDETAQLHDRVHSQISHVDFALYRPYPDPERAERMALV
ncbi:MAG: DUF6614 family protein [Roseovarius sp.]|nr:DUF6614 family protein [Roseovarius sp.]